MPCFWPVFGPFSQFWGQKFFPENPALSCTTSYGFLASCQNLVKTNNVIPRKRPDRRKDGWKDGWKDGQTLLFYRTFPATAGGPKRHALSFIKTSYISTHFWKHDTKQYNFS